MSATRLSRRFPSALRTATVALLCAVALSGCRVTQDETASSDTHTSKPTPSAPAPTATVTVTETPSAPAASTPSGSPAAGQPTPTASGPEGALLSAAEFPPLNEQSSWTEKSTGAASADPFGLCQKTDLSSIGAQTTVERTFTAGRDTAAQQVADLPDAQTAVRATRVIQAWHDDCRGRVVGRNVVVRPFTDVAVTQGKASWYLVSYVRGGQGHFHSLGLVVRGTRLTLLRIDQVGQDHNYEPGQDPMELAVKAAASKLGG